MAASTFYYEPLTNPHEQIRLLTIKSSRDNDSVLVGSMSCHSLPPISTPKRARLRGHVSLPSYFALSYVWGSGHDLEKTHELVLDGRRFLVTANVHGALRAVRNSSGLSFKFWIDAVCIDESNLEEKSAQIPLMRDIYSMSMLTMIWLGESTEESTKAMRFIGTLTNSPLMLWMSELVNQSNEVYTQRKSTYQNRGPLREIVSTEIKRSVIDALTAGSKPIVRGVRVGAELFLSPIRDDVVDEDYPEARRFISDGEDADDEGEDEREVMTSMMSWRPNPKYLKLVKAEDFPEMARLIEKWLLAETKYFDRMWTLQEACVSFFPTVMRGGPYGILVEDLLRTAHFLNRELGTIAIRLDKATALQQLVNAWNHGRRLHLRELLYISRDRECEDPRDKIYALQGLMKDAMNPLLVPDYSKSAAEVYANAARHMLVTSNSLDLICLTHSQQLPDLPSWTPDFRHFAQNHGLTSLVDVRGKTRIYKTSFSEEPYILDDNLAKQSWRTLSVDGLFLGGVQIVSKPAVDSETFSSIECNWSTAMKIGGTQNGFLDTSKHAALDIASRLVRLYSEYHRDSDKSLFWSCHPDKFQQLRRLTGKAHNQGKEGKDMHDIYLSTLICGRKDLTSRCEFTDIEQLMSRSCIPDEQGTEALRTLCKSLEAGLRGRRLIVMETKVAQIGAATEDVRVGDLVCVLFGCSVPVILRRVPESDLFTIVGECYICGYMDGEAVKLKYDGKLEARKFVLR